MSTEDKIIDALARKNYKGAILGTVLMFSKSILDRKEDSKPGRQKQTE